MNKSIDDFYEEDKLIQDNEEFFKNLIKLLPDAVFVEKNGKFIFVNDEGVKLLHGKNQNDIIGKDVRLFMHRRFKKILDIYEKDKFKYTLDNKTRLTKKKLITLNNKVIDVEIKAIDIIDKKNKDEITAVIVRDITQYLQLEKIKRNSQENKKLLEKEREFNKMQTEFFANLSHELKTPLNVILSSQQLLALYLRNGEFQGIDYEKIEKHLKTLKQNSNRLLRLINNLIDITRIDSGFFSLNLKKYNIVSIVEDITLAVVEYIKNKDIKLIFDTDIEEKFTICDKDKIERIILNLLSNAIKFTPSGGNIKVNIHDDGESLRITVRDNGIGIPEDKIHIIFDRFRQVDTSFTRISEGSGIGLSLVKALVEMHSGTISVESEYRKGSEFIITLPIKTKKVKRNTGDEDSLDNSLKEHKLKKVEIEFSDIYNI